MLATSTAHQIGVEEALWTTIDEVIYYYDLYGKSMSDEAYADFVRYFNKYLEAVKPATRVKEVVELLSEKVVLTTWEAGISPEVLRSLLVELVNLRYYGARLEEVKRLLKKLVNALTDDHVEIEEFARTPEETLALALTLLVIATNPY